MIGVILFMALAFVVGWAVQHPAAWAILLLPVLFALVAGDVSVIGLILGIALMAAAVLAGRWVAQRYSPTEKPRKAAAPAQKRAKSPGSTEQPEKSTAG